MINPENFGVIAIKVTRDEIEAFDHTFHIDFLNAIKTNAKKFENKIILTIDGYDADERALWEVPEVRNYFDFLDRIFPYWFYFLNRDLPVPINSLILLFYLVVPLKMISPRSLDEKLWDVDLNSFSNFMKIHFHYLNELTQELKMTSEENKKISEGILKLYQEEILNKLQTEDKS